MKFYCTTGFYTFWGFQRYIICYFWTYRSKVMIFQSFSPNLIQFLFWIFVWFREGHVAWYYWKIPVRPDRLCLPLDLKKIWRLRSLRTRCSGPLDSNLTVEMGGKGGSHRLGFRRCIPARCRRRHSGGLWKRQRGGQRSAWRGESRCVVSVVDYFQWRGREVAGGARAEMDFGRWWLRRFSVK
jgi:hypothetical protein